MTDGTGGGGSPIERLGPLSVGVLLVVWLVFLAKYILGFALPPALNTALIVVGVAAGIGVFLWLSRHSRLL